MSLNALCDVDNYQEKYTIFILRPKTQSRSHLLASVLPPKLRSRFRTPTW